jgi:hypothetical protein
VPESCIVHLNPAIHGADGFAAILPTSPGISSVIDLPESADIGAKWLAAQ